MKLLLALKKVQNHLSGSHSPIKKIVLYCQIYDSPAPSESVHRWLIGTSDGSSAQWSSAQVLELPQNHFDNKQYGTLFS